MVAITRNILKNIKLYNLNGRIVWFMNYISIKLLPEKYSMACEHFRVSHFADHSERRMANASVILAGITGVAARIHDRLAPLRTVMF